MTRKTGKNLNGGVPGKDLSLILPLAERSSDVRMISAMRVILALSALLVIYIDPSEPVLPIDLALTGYGIYSVLIYVLAIRNSRKLPNKILHRVDVAPRIHERLFFCDKTLTGVRAGGFTINAVVDPNGLSPNVSKTCDGGSPASEPITGLNRTDRTVSDRGLSTAAREAAVQTQKHVLSEKDALKEVQLIDEPSRVATGVLPDLTIRDMCLTGSGVAETLRVLIANIGDRDEDPFELGIKYISYTDDSGFWDVDTLTGLKTGEERWLAYSPISGTGFMTSIIVPRAFKFQAIADPSYRQGYGPLGIYLRDVKSKIPETNEGNNALTISRADMRRCDAKSLTKPANPRIETVKPVRP